MATVSLKNFENLVLYYGGSVQRDVLSDSIVVKRNDGVSIRVPQNYFMYLQDESVLLSDLLHFLMNRKDNMMPSYDLAKIEKMKEDSKKTLSILLGAPDLEHIVVAGGFFTSIYHAEAHNDIDVFILNDENTQYQIMASINHIFFNSPNRFKITTGSYMNVNNKNIRGVRLDKITKIQYIFTAYNSREELIEHFDAEHCCVSYYKDKLYTTNSAFECLKNKVLKPNKGNKIEQWRKDKFLSRGFKLAANSI